MTYPGQPGRVGDAARPRRAGPALFLPLALAICLAPGRAAAGPLVQFALGGLYDRDGSNFSIELTLGWRFALLRDQLFIAPEAGIGGDMPPVVRTIHVGPSLTLMRGGGGSYFRAVSFGLKPCLLFRNADVGYRTVLRVGFLAGLIPLELHHDVAWQDGSPRHAVRALLGFDVGEALTLMTRVAQDSL